VLLISLDTLRADHLGYNGYDRPTSPFLDELASQAVVFENHFSNSNCTLPSHASMLTGLHYATHGVFPGKTADKKFHVLPESIPTLAQRLREAGYRTSAIVNHEAWLNPTYGFDKGFDSFTTRWGHAPETVDEHLAALDRAAAEGLADAPSFSFLHFFDIHSDNWNGPSPCYPYQSSEELIAQFAGPRPEGFTGCIPDGACASIYLKAVSRHRLPLPEEHLKYLVGLYDAGIAQLDGELRRLFTGLEERGLLEETLVVITADHGEEFFEHEKLLHDGLHDEVTRIPLMILAPKRTGVTPRGVTSITQSTQITPTILDLCGQEPIGQSPSLAAAVMAGTTPVDERVFLHKSVLVGRDETSEFKLSIHDGELSFYDRTQDPLEQVDLLTTPGYAQQHWERLSRLRVELLEGVRGFEELGEALRQGAAASSELSPARRAELEALGYF
jgi:arylsulfatase